MGDTESLIAPLHVSERSLPPHDVELYDDGGRVIARWDGALLDELGTREQMTENLNAVAAAFNKNGGPRGFRAWSFGRLYVTTFRHTGSYPITEHSWTVTDGKPYGEGRALCWRPWLHRSQRHRSHRAFVIGLRTKGQLT